MSKTKPTPTVDLTAELEADAQAQATAQAEAEQLARERQQVEAMASGTPAADAVALGETPEERAARELAEDAARRKEVGMRYYVATGDSKITDPETLKTFTNDKATKSELTGWLDFQIANGKITVEE